MAYSPVRKIKPRPEGLKEGEYAINISLTRKL